MRKLILLFLLVGICLAGKSQSNLPYKPLSAFNKDTTAFVIYNFIERADNYKGKTLKEVSHDLQIPVKYLVESIGKRGSYIIGLDIYIYDKERVLNIFNDENVEFYAIYVYWENQIPVKAGDKYITDEKERFEKYKDYKIKEIGVALSPKYKDYDKYTPKKTKTPESGGYIKDGKLIYRMKIHR